VLSGRIFLLAGSAYVVDLFLHWFGRAFGGWDVALLATSGYLALALVLVELARLRAVWRSPTSSLLEFFLAAGAGLLCVAGLLHVHWNGGIITLKFSEYEYGAWIGLALAIIFLAGAVLRLREHENLVADGRRT
jgi:hypothetical protein